MKTIFRPHRGSLQESIDAGFEVSCLKDVIEELNKTAIFPLDLNNTEIAYYGYDDRISSECYIVSIPGYGVLGFVNRRIPVDLTNPKAIEECINEVPVRNSPRY